MKRHNQPDDDENPERVHQSKTRRISPAGRRVVSDEEGSVDLDLNATPLGFDLNAPVEEEELLQSNSYWVSVESKPDNAETARINPLPEEVTPLDQLKAENVPNDSVQGLVDEVHRPLPTLSTPDGDNVDVSPKEEEGSDQGESPSVKAEEVEEPGEKPPVIVPAVFCRPFEPLNISTSDEDLELLRSVWSAWQQEDAEALDMTVADSLEELGKHPLSPNRYLLLSSIYISKKLPEAFCLPRTLKALLTFLESATAQTVVKRQSLLPLLASRLLHRAFAGESDWPIEFVQVYLLDSTGSRAWVDLEGCKEFVSNVLTAFPDSVLDVSSVNEDTAGLKFAEQGGAGDMQQVQAVKAETNGSSAVKNRYSRGEMQQRVRGEFCHYLNQLLGASSSKENPRQLLRLLMQGAGFEEVRVVASSMLEGWLNNPVHMRAAKSLLDRILQHTRGTSENDFNTVANLLALRISSTQAPGQIKTIHNNIFSEMITHLVRRRPEYATLALKTFVTTELHIKNPHNIRSIITVLKAMPSEDNPPEHELANILQELAASDDSRSLLCDFVRRMMKQAGGEFDVHALCHGLIQPWPLMAEQDELLKEAWINKLVDLTCQLLLHAAAPFVEDEGLFNAITLSSHPGTTLGTFVPGHGLERSVSGGPSRDKLTMLEKLSTETQNFQMQAMAWCTDVVAAYLPHIGHAQFQKIVRQLLFLEEVEAYFTNLDPVIETESKCVKLMGACTRAPEEIVARLILMGISNFPMESAKSLDIIEVLVCRAAKLERLMEGSLVASSNQLPAAIFKLASFNLRGVTRQPVPQLVVKDMYWQACLVVLIVAVFNPSTIGRYVWESIPSLRSLMEVLIAGDKVFYSSRSSEASQLEFEKTEADAEQLDMKAEDIVSKFLAEKRRTATSMIDGDDLEGSDTEWKGKLMILNHPGPIRKPTQAVYDKLHQLNETYQLGHLLRKCRSPDFFSEVTALQTLQQAWPWLRSIISREPEVVSHFPIAWKCELLYMLEGGHPTTQNLSVDLLQLQAELRQVVTTQSKEKEIDIVMGFLARKLVAKQFSVRHRARRCLSSLFQTTAKQPDVQVSLPPSPREHKRGETASGVASRWAVHAMDAVAIHHTKKPTAGSSGSSSLHVSPGIFSGMAVSTPSAERSKTALQGSGVEDYTSWLDTLQTASRLTSTLLPSIQVALQQETSINVVVAYLDFLKKHASALPARQSMACSLASFLVHRKMLTSSLLSAPVALSSALTSDSAEIKSHSGTIDLILDTLSEALESGTSSEPYVDESGSELGLVTLASPQYLGTEQVVRRVSVHKIVVDASIKVLSLLAFNYGKGYEEKQGFSRMLNILFPDTQFPLAWIEGKSGEKLPLLTEDQAILFARSNVEKLIRAGLAASSLKQKLDLCEKLGLSPVAATTLLQDLDTVTQHRLEAELGPRGSFCRRTEKLQKCVRSLMQGKSSGVHFLRLLDMYAAPTVRDISQLPMVSPSSEFRGANDVARIDSACARTLSGEELADKALVKLEDAPRIENSANELADSSKELSMKQLIEVPLHRLEKSLRSVLNAKLNHTLWSDEEATETGGSEHKNGMLISEMLEILNVWRRGYGNLHQNLGLRARVEWTGRCTLILENLMLIDPEFLSSAYLTFLFEDGPRTVFSIPKLALDFMIQNISWQNISRILKVILGVFMERDGELDSKLQRRNILDEASSVLEFILLCIRHPRTILACRLNEELDPLEGTKTFLSLFDSESAEALTMLTTADLMAANLPSSRPHLDVEENGYSLNRVMSDHPALISSSRAMKVLLAASCQGKRILSTIIEKLHEIGQGSNADLLSSLNYKSELKGTSIMSASVAAQDLLAGLYLAFPVLVRTVLQSAKGQKCQAIDLTSFLQDHKFLQGKCMQTCTLSSVLHRALRSICKGSEKDAKAAYGFCHDMARQHPTLIVPHLPTLSVLLKEMLPMVKQQDVQGRTTVARTYSLGISLLDALRPYLLANNSNSPNMTSRRASLEVILGFYFEFLQCLEIQDRPQFAKVVARLADFLCHCVDAGGYYRDYVLSYRTPVLQSAAQTFGKIKKLGFLLGMLDKPWGSIVPKSSMKNSADDGKTTSLVGPPSLPFEDVLKVRTQLLQCIRWQGSKKPQDSRLELFNTRVNSYSVWYEMKGLDVEEANLTGTLSDLERASARMPTILSALEDSLLELTDISDANVRDRAYVLLERLLLHCPSESSATNILQRLLQQLSSSDSSLAKTAAKQASRFFYYCSEFQETILVEMLQMGRFASDDLQQLLQGLFTVSGAPSQ